MGFKVTVLLLNHTYVISSLKTQFFIRAADSQHPFHSSYGNFPSLKSTDNYLQS